MKKQKLNILFLYFLLITVFQLSFCFRTLQTQKFLDNKFNIKDDVLHIDLIDTPEKISEQILMIFADGVRYDKLIEAQTPNIDKLRANGTTFTEYHSVLPSFSRVNYAAFSSGASTNITSVFSNAFNDNLSIPSLYTVAKSNGFTTGIVSDGKSWIRMLRDFDIVVKVDQNDELVPNKDVFVKDAAISIIENNFSQLQFIDFSSVDDVGHYFGAASSEYLETIEQIDSYVGDIINTYANIGQLENTTIVFFSDHGHDDIGGHGGDFYNQTHASLIIANKGIKEHGIFYEKRVTMNSVTPTLLAMLGLPISPTMNGVIQYEVINSTTKSKAIYAILMTENIKQQLEISVEKIKLLPKKTKNNFELEISRILDNITQTKSEYQMMNYETAFEVAIKLEKITRKTLSDLFFQFGSFLLLIRILSIIVTLVVLILAFYLLHRFSVIEINHQEVFNKKMIVSEIIGAISSISTAIIIFVITDFNYNPNRFNYLSQPLIPNILAIILGSLVAVFVPWFTYYLLEKKTNNYSSFKEWRPIFLRVSIGSIFVISLPILGFVFYYIIKNGPWPIWFIPNQSDYFAYMIVGILTCVLYLIAITLTFGLWISQKTRKGKNLQIN